MLHKYACMYVGVSWTCNRFRVHSVCVVCSPPSTSDVAQPLSLVSQVAIDLSQQNTLCRVVAHQQALHSRHTALGGKWGIFYD